MPYETRTRDVMVAGHWPVRDGHVPGEEAIAADFKRTMARLTV